MSSGRRTRNAVFLRVLPPRGVLPGPSIGGIRVMEAMHPALVLGALALAAGFGAALFLRWGGRWGATAEECALAMPGDAWLDGGPRARVRMTRAITIAAAPETVWPWLAQLGRGAGWCSYDRLDNGGRTSARHLVSWIPPPAPGDATALGFLRHLEPGRALAWWIPGDRLLGATVRSVMAYRVVQVGDRTRLIERFSWDAAGVTGWAALRFFQVLDTIMARRQLLDLKERVELYGGRSEDPAAPETGARDQYQLYHVIYASGEEAGRAGEEKAARWRRAALRAAVDAEDGLEGAERASVRVASARGR